MFGDTSHILNAASLIINLAAVCLFVLELPKPIYGLVDAPLLWQLALLYFLVVDLGGRNSLLDE